MAAQNLSPRQKMINLLYFVLLAILALNVSSEVLDAFKTVNDGINTSNSSLQSKNSDTYFNLSKQFYNDSLKAKEAYEKSLQARQLSARLYDLLEQYKTQMISEAGGIDTSTGKIKRDDDIDIATRLFVEKEGRTGRALKKEIETTRSNLLNLLGEELRKEVSRSMSLQVEEPVSGKSWEFAKFNHVPVVAAVTILSKYQNDLLGAESHIIETLYSSINKNIKNVDRMEAKIISPSNFILQGENYKADVMVAAYSSTVKPEAFLGQFNGSVKKDADGNYLPVFSASDVPPLVNAQKVDVQGGFGKIQMAANATGNRKYSGVVRVKGQGDGYEFYPFEGEYQVAPKLAVVSPTKMNVMYIGLDNLIDVSVPGIAQNEVTPVLVGDGTLARKPDGSYVAHVNTQGTVKVAVKAKINGRDIVMGEQPFRVKRVPDPVTTLDGVYEGGKITLAKIKSTRGVVPQTKDFEFGAKFTIVSYQMSYRSKKEDNVSIPITVEGPAYSSKVKDLITERIAAGDAVFFDEVIVRGPAGDRRKINPVAFVVTK